MSSSDKPSQPMRPPFNATNSWVIRQARDLIDYDSYDIEKWLGEIDDGAPDENNGQVSGKSPAHFAGGMRHPAGELEDYDPDCIAFSQLSIVERLEAMAAVMEARYHDDESESSKGSFVTSTEDSCNLDETSSSTSLSSSSSYYGILLSNSLEGKSLISDCRGANSGSTTGSETSITHSDDEERSALSYPSRDKTPSPGYTVPVPSPPSSGTGLDLEAEAKGKAAYSRYLAHMRLRSKMLGSPTSPPKSKSQFLTVPPPAYKAKARHSRANQRRKERYTNPHTYSYPNVHVPDIQRGPSPMPSLRPLSTSPLTSPSFPPRPTSIPGEILSCENPLTSRSTAEAQASLRVRISRNVGGRERPSPEIFRPTPQRAGRLFVPSPSRAQFAASPFVRSNLGEVPVVILEEDEEEEEERRGRSR